MPAVSHTQCQGWRHPPCDDPSPAFQELGSRLGGEAHPARQGYPGLCPRLLDCCTSVLNTLPSHLTWCDLGTVQLKMKRSQPRGKPPRLLCWGAPPAVPPAARDLLSLLSGAVKCLIQAFIWHPQL